MFKFIPRLPGKQSESSLDKPEQTPTTSFFLTGLQPIKLQQALSIFLYEGVLKLTSVMFFAHLLPMEVING